MIMVLLLANYSRNIIPQYLKEKNCAVLIEKQKQKSGIIILKN